MGNEINEAWLVYVRLILTKFVTRLLNTSEVETESFVELLMRYKFNDCNFVFSVIDEPDIQNRLFVLANEDKVSQHQTDLNQFIKNLIQSKAMAEYACTCWK